MKGSKFTGEGSRRQRRAGWEYLDVCVDGNSRLAYGKLLPDEKAVSAACFLIRAVGWFERHGVTADRVLPDIGGSHRSRGFLISCRNVDVRPKKTRPTSHGQKARSAYNDSS